MLLLTPQIEHGNDLNYISLIAYLALTKWCFKFLHNALAISPSLALNVPQSSVNGDNNGPFPGFVVVGFALFSEKLLVLFLK